MIIYISRDAFAFIISEVKKAKNIETGGILLGVILKSKDVLITHAIGPGPKAIKRSSIFQKDYEYSLKMLNILYKKYSVDFLGDWHKHPNNCIEYSKRDYLSMINISKINSRPCFFIIVGNNITEDDGGIKIYSVNNSYSIQSYPFQIVDEPEKLALEKGI